MIDSVTIEILKEQWSNNPYSFKIDRLKTVEPHFTNVWNGCKTFEFRFNDRNYQTDQILILESQTDGKKIVCFVPHILKTEDFPAIPNDWVILSIVVLFRIR